MVKKRVTMADIAKITGVSRTTVSFILNDVPDISIPDSTRQRVLQAAQDLHYVPNTHAANLARGKTMLIALVVRQSEQNLSSDYFMAEVSRGITSAIAPYDYHLLLHSAEPGSDIGQLARARKVDGLIISSLLVDDEDLESLISAGIPLVQHGVSRSETVPSVDVDNIAGAWQAVDYLIGLGHKRIAYISNGPLIYVAAQDRLEGYYRRLEDAGILVDDTLVQEGNFTEHSGLRAMQALLALPDPPTAVFVGSDVVAMGAMAAAVQHGLSIPQDIAIIGFDNLHFGSYLQPPLTTIHLPAQEIGQHLGQMVMAMLRGEPLETLDIRLPTELVIRSSAQILEGGD